MFSDIEKENILRQISSFFDEQVVENHIKNTEKLVDIRKINFNPFLVSYLARFAFGDASPRSIAKAILYPRVLGTSISTSFGSAIQKLSSQVLKGFASTTSGIDIEYKDSLNNRHIYCQLKSGPETINKDDVKTICDHFKDLGRLAKTNGSNDLNPLTDCVVGILYGSREDLSANYKRIESEGYTVKIGQEFWESFTGDKNFYDDLIKTITNISSNRIDNVLKDTIEKLAKSISENKDIIPGIEM